MFDWLRKKDGDCLAVLENVNNALREIKNLLSFSITMEKNVMSKLTDWAAEEQADLTAISNTLDQVVTGIAALDVLITQFQNSPGTLAPGDQAALDGIQAASKALVTKSAAISVTPPVPPAV
jgi:hypothetical protein